MKCPECIKLGLKSKVYPGASSCTLMAVNAYYDEEGVYHYDDPNITTTRYSCSNGHEWVERWESNKIVMDING